MDAKKCDRCGILYEPKWIPSMLGVGTSHLEFYSKKKGGSIGRRKTYDLCPDCAKAVRMWLKNNRKSQPTNMVQEGEWELSDMGETRCSLCKCKTYIDDAHMQIFFDYCPNCGAWMKNKGE